jgi:hypothetical protein
MVCTTRLPALQLQRRELGHMTCCHPARAGPAATTMGAKIQIPAPPHLTTLFLPLRFRPAGADGASW